MNYPYTDPNRFRIVRQHFTDGAANSNFQFIFSDYHIRDLISLTFLVTRDADASTPIIGISIWSGLGVLSYRHWGSTTYDVGDPIEFNAFQGTSYTGRTIQHGSIIFPLPSPCFILPNDLLAIQSDFPPGHCTFTQINATYKFWPME